MVKLTFGLWVNWSWPMVSPTDRPCCDVRIDFMVRVSSDVDGCASRQRAAKAGAWMKGGNYPRDTPRKVGRQLDV